MKNPFYFRVLPLSGPYCNREKELEQLVAHAQNKANVVLFSPRRYGKTSLVHRVQEKLKNKGMATVYVDLFGIDSLEDLAGRMASRLYGYCQKNESLLNKAMHFLSSWRPVIRPDPEYGLSLTVESSSGRKGIELLDHTLEGFGRFIQEAKKGVHIVFDEFQEITELRGSLQIEGRLRSHIQTHTQASYFFVGSRRRLLNDIFNSRKRPFYRSSISFPLPPLPVEEGVRFIIEQFKCGGKTCPEMIGKKIFEKTSGYPYYVQRVSYSIFEGSGKKVTEEDFLFGFKKTIEEEGMIFEAMIQALSLQQIKLLSAIALEPIEKPFAIDYLARHGLGSIGGVQGALKRLLELDYIERKGKLLVIVDPLFGTWLRHLKE
ncbi:MAG: ATP-binding protein [Thermodesulfobacteriota bacterium]